MTADLSQPMQLGELRLANRVVMAPMTRNRAGEGNAPTELHATYYAQRAGAGLIISCATQISPTGVGYPHTPGIHTDQQVTGWSRVVKRVHAAGGRMFLQLWHVGRISHPSLQPEGAVPVAPSAIKPEGQCMTYSGPRDFVTPRALATDEIPAIIDQYRQAAVHARDAGFDGVELHAANGYLLDQFLRDGTNHRDDRYGGSIENRVRILLEVVAAVTSVWEPMRVGVRISPLNTFNSMTDSDPQATFGHVAAALAPFGLGYLHVVEASIEAGVATPATGFDYAALKRGFGGYYMANGAYDRKRAEAVLRQGRADLVSFGVLFLANPDLPERLRRGGPFNAADRSTFYGGGAEGCTDYPYLDS